MKRETKREAGKVMMMMMRERGSKARVKEVSVQSPLLGSRKAER